MLGPRLHADSRRRQVPIMPILVIGIALVAIAVMGLALADRAAHERFLSRAARIKAEAGVQDDAPVTERAGT